MDYYVGSMVCSDGELLHYGRLGMKWGKHIFGKDPSESGAARHKGVKKTAKQRRVEKKRNKQRLSNLEKARKAAADKRTFEQRKKDIIAKGTAADALSIKNRLTNQEMQQIVTRLNLEKQLSEIANKDYKSAFDKLSSFNTKLNTMSTFVGNSTTAYNNLAKVLNSLTDSNLPMITDKKDTIPASIKSIILSNDAEKVLRNMKNLKDSQVQEAVKRIYWQKELSELMKGNYNWKDKKKNKSDDDED